MKEPNVLGVAPTPLYNSFEDVDEFVTLLGVVPEDTETERYIGLNFHDYPCVGLLTDS